MKKYEVLLNFFSGFYESIHDGVFDDEETRIIEDYPGHNWDEISASNMTKSAIVGITFLQYPVKLD